MKEEQLEEIEALKAIYMDDFSTLDDHKKIYAIQITPHFEGMYQIQLTLQFQFCFPEEYPNVPFALENISIKFSKPCNPEVVKELRELIVHSCEELLGTPMVYNLIEKIKEYLEKINPLLNEGDFIILSDESIMNVFEYLSPDDLGWVACVNKNWKRISEDRRLWRQFCLKEEAKFTNYKKKNEIEDEESLELDWKNIYLEMMHRRISEMKFVSPVLLRRGTGDEWPAHIGSWLEHFSNSFQQRRFSLSNGNIFYTSIETKESILFGHYRILTKQKGELLFGKLEWMNYVRSLVSECPYIGEIAGFFLYTPISGSINAVLLRSVMEECRSVVAQVHSPHEYIPSVVLNKILLEEVLNRTPQEMAAVGLLSNPNCVRAQNMYLSDLVNYVNRKINFAISKDDGKKDKKDKKVKNIRQYVEFRDRNGQLYPFRFEYWEAFAAVLSRVWIKIWHFNSLSNSLQENWKKKLDTEIVFDHFYYELESITYKG